MATTELAVSGNIIRSMDDVERAAAMMAKSGFFQDASQAAQAAVKVMAGQEIGIGAFASMVGIHIIKGRPAIGANIMAAKVKSSGKYDYSVTEMTDKTCRLVFTQHGKEIGRSEFTIEDARKAGTQNLDKFPRNMLFARAMSNGVKWFTPDVFLGVTVYTPEEMGAKVDEDGEVITVVPTTVTTSKQPTAAQTPASSEPDEIDMMFPPIDYQASAAPLRFDPPALQAHIGTLATEYKDQTANDKQIQLAAAMLGLCFGGDETNRKELQHFLVGKQSMKEMSGPEIRAILKWLEPAKDASGKYWPNNMSMREANAALVAARKALGQVELPA